MPTCRADMPQRSPRPAVRSKIWIEVGRRFAVGDGGIALLSALEETGSIREAASRVKWSYRHALAYLDNMEEALGWRLLERARGDTRGAAPGSPPRAGASSGATGPSAIGRTPRYPASPGPRSSRRCDARPQRVQHPRAGRRLRRPRHVHPIPRRVPHREQDGPGGRARGVRDLQDLRRGSTSGRRSRSSP